MTRILLLNQGHDNSYLIAAVVIIFILLLPAILLFGFGFYFRKKKPKTSNTLFIMAGVYLLIGLGYCGFMSV